MPVTSGLRQIRGYLTLGGQQFAVERASVNQSGQSRSGAFQAIIPLQSFNGGDRFFSSLSDNSATLEVSVNGTRTTLLKGEADCVNILYHVGEVHISGRDESAKLHEGKSSEKFTNQQRSDIIQTVAQRNGLQVQIDQDSLMGGKKLQIDFAKMTDGVSDAAIIHKLCEQMGARWWIKDSTLYVKTGTSGNYVVRYQPPTGGQPMQGDFIAMSVNMNLQAMKGISVTVNSWHDGKKKVITAQKQSNGKVSGNLKYNYRAAGLEQDHADDLAKHKLKEVTRHKISCNIQLPGDTSIDVGMGLQLQGTAFNETLEMDSITHSIGDSYYIMDISARSQGDDGSGGGAGGNPTANVPLPPTRPIDLGGSVPLPPTRPAGI